MSNLKEKYLFNPQCNGRTNRGLTVENQPKLNWKFQVPSHPVYGFESMPVKDEDGNIYVGNHNGSLYKLNPEGQLLNTFQTKYKIFSTPITIGNRCYFASGDGYVYSLDEKGNLAWKTQVSNEPLLKKPSYLQSVIRQYIKRDKSKFSIGTVRTWASMNLDSKGRLYINTAGTGVNVLDINGNIIKQLPTKYKFPLSGVSFLENDDFVFCDEKEVVYAYDNNFKQKWTYNIDKTYNLWSNPVVCLEKKLIFLTGSKSDESIIVCLNFEGRKVWEIKINSEIRGTSTLNHKGQLIVPCFDGNLLFLDQENGQLQEKVKLTSCDRALWTSPIVDKNNNIYVTVKTSRTEGKLNIINNDFKIIHTIDCGKTLSPPTIDEHNNLFFGDWNGYLYSYNFFD
ncbi:PQQ-binding-like beta-propeller repeat protein [Flammeovirga sp. SubArs3]|uniref:outer membrane protein assembly factor BamB family protein n=1 Tax=Flammeovirga sp. SubArs3 TaxID=2995316 RepID=UPI00248B795C|nr:PQQ-binding-like beta-propeller repeat protein [Flammeovirga sp. SubArs3]